MSLSDLGSIGEFVGSIAVVVSLLYLAVQIRQNTRSVRASTNHASIISGNAINLAFAESEAAQIVLKAGSGASDLNLEERFRFTMFMRATFSFYEDAYLQSREGFLDPEVWESRSKTIALDLAQPGVGEWWVSNRHLYSKGFQEAVAGLIPA